jgi:hypothetical protein
LEWELSRRRRRVQFLAFSAKFEIDLDRAPREDRLELQSNFTLSSTATKGFRPHIEPVTLQVGTFAGQPISRRYPPGQSIMPIAA